ncbi:MAG: CPBP family intramembrane metalloprotease [Clostridia bacterium]|nr:CPBP family intramembrane metalloprotease [Clostridia bacterium]
MENASGQNSSTKELKLYNPNRFNGLDGALCFITVLVAFALMPYVVKLLLGDVLLAISKYDTYIYMVISVTISQAVIFFVGFVYCKIRRVNPFAGGGYKASWDGIHVLMSIMLTLGVMMLFYFTHSQFFGYASELLPSSQGMPTVISPFSALFALIYIAEIAVLPAIAEEMVFRGIIMRGFEQFGGLFAVLCSSVMFSLMHGNFGQLILQFIGGLAIGGVVYITKNYLLGSIMHFVNNAFSIIYTLLIIPLTDSPISYKITAVTGSVTIILGVVFCLVSGIYFISMLIEKEKNRALGKDTSFKYEKKRYYLMQSNGKEKLCPHDSVPTFYIKDERDDRLFLIKGQYRALNKGASYKLSFILICVGILLATILLFLG